MHLFRPALDCPPRQGTFGNTKHTSISRDQCRAEIRSDRSMEWLDDVQPLGVVGELGTPAARHRPPKFAPCSASLDSLPECKPPTREPVRRRHEPPATASSSRRPPPSSPRLNPPIAACDA